MYKKVNKNGLWIDSAGIHRYYKNGKLHNENGPAVISNNNCWHYIEGKLHNEKGPAIYPTVEKISETYTINPVVSPPQWWYKGRHVICSSQEEFEKLLKLKAF